MPKIFKNRFWFSASLTRRIFCSSGKGPSPFFLMLLFSHSILAAYAPFVSALQTPPDLIVNHQTKQCAELFRGSVCTTCLPPAGWVELSKGPYGPCPEGYKKVEIKPVCYASKSSFCCSDGHSGAPGDCKDLLINQETKQCAFVKDLSRCTSLPIGWLRPKDHSCPSKGYNWLSKELDCPTSEK